MNETMPGWLIQVGGVVVVGVWLVAGVQAQTEIPAEQRAEVERRVEEMEAQFRRIRDQAIARCRGAWSGCTNQRCRKISETEASRWQACQDACNAEYGRCKSIAYEYWSEDE